jgi:uncharacterized membrane protein
VLYTTNRFFVDVLIPAGLDFAGLAIIVGGALLAVILLRPTVKEAGSPEAVVIAVPFVFHVFFMAAGLIFGYYVQSPILAVIGVVMFLSGMLLHVWPRWARSRAPATAPSRARQTG